MAVTITCQKCGAENRLGSLFCRECGEKLDLKSLRPDSHVRRGVAAGVGGLVARLVRLAVFLAVVGTLALLLWGAPMPGDAPAAGGAQRVQAKMTALRGAILRNNEVLDSFSEADINAYLNARLANAIGGAGAMKMEFQEVNLAFRDDAVAAWIKVKLGPVPLTYSAEASVRRAGPRLALSAGKVAIGRLPMPGPLRDRVIRQFTAVFTPLQEEQVLINRLPHVRPVEGALEAGTVRP